MVARIASNSIMPPISTKTTHALGYEGKEIHLSTYKSLLNWLFPNVALMVNFGMRTMGGINI